MKIGDYIDEVIFWFDWAWLHKIPFPSWPKFIRDEGEVYSLQEWFGDFGCFWFGFVIGWFLNLSNRYLPHDWERWDKIELEEEVEGEEEYEDV
jgi:hypothetical protein